MPNPPRVRIAPLRHNATLFAILGSFLLPVSASASGIFQDGASARSKALGGIGAAGMDGATDALAGNPAALSHLRSPTFQLGLDAGWVDGEFRDRFGRSSDFQEHAILPHGALSYPAGPFTFGLGVTTEAALRADWRYEDLPGGLGGSTSHGVRTHKSELALIRFALGGSYAVSPEFSFGASVGLLYNRNRLEAPYTIQTQPQITGAKTLLDLETEGWGWNAQFGALWRPLPTLELGLSYTLRTRIRSEGRAFIDARRQLTDLGFLDVDTDSTFDAEATNKFPQILSAALAWQATPRLSFLAQVDWINWSDAFDTLDVRLRHADSQFYPTLVDGKSNLDDDIPLDWRDQWVFRAGAEYALGDQWKLRAGYRYAENPVPSETLTPLNAAVNEHMLSVGIGYSTGRTSVDLAWQWHIPNEEHIARSRLLNGEYTGSAVQASIHWITLTTTIEF
jgi:long-chain fatty acid transport protein